ncbi:MAG: hypothetical protein D3908_02000 [Candidatus Electrothrix sp. AUS4]|nr:hypothetical protein [Candidatus Electrothrix sp. AUS4]
MVGGIIVNRNNFLVQYQSMVYLLLFFISIVLGLVAYILQPDGTIQSLIVNISSELFSVALLFVILNKLLEEKNISHANDKISIILTDGSKEITLPAEIRRAEFTRQEILGRIGMLQRKDTEDENKRFRIKYLSLPAFLLDINRIAETEGDTSLYIHCSKEELSQFDLTPM